MVRSFNKSFQIHIKSSVSFFFILWQSKVRTVIQFDFMVYFIIKKKSEHKPLTQASRKKEVCGLFIGTVLSKIYYQIIRCFPSHPLSKKHVFVCCFTWAVNILVTRPYLGNSNCVQDSSVVTEKSYSGKLVMLQWKGGYKCNTIRVTIISSEIWISSCAFWYFLKIEMLIYNISGVQPSDSFPLQAVNKTLNIVPCTVQ